MAATFVICVAWLSLLLLLLLLPRGSRSFSVNAWLIILSCECVADPTPPYCPDWKLACRDSMLAFLQTTDTSMADICSMPCSHYMLIGALSHQEVEGMVVASL